MKTKILFISMIMLSCQAQKVEIFQCEEEVCLQLRNHDDASVPWWKFWAESNQSTDIDIYMINSIPVAGFQCDLNGVKIEKSTGGLLEKHGFDASNSANRVLAFSMQAKTIPVGKGILTTINLSEPFEEVCMTSIIFAGAGGEKVSTNTPECIKSN